MKTIQQNLTTINYTTGSSTSRIKYIVIHYTANNGDTAYGNTSYFKSTYRGASAHYFVDTTSIWQCVADKNVAWHCGTTGTYYHAACRNSNSIGIELCSLKDSSGNYYFADATVENAVELTKYLMNLYNVPIANVIRHYDVTHKVCPAPYVNNTTAWNNFLSKCSSSESTTTSTTKTAVTQKIKIDSGETFTLSGYNIDGHNLFPARTLLTKMGYTVGWDNSSKKVTVTKYGVQTTLNVSTLIFDSTSYVYVREAGEFLDYTVGYENGIITLTTPTTIDKVVPFVIDGVEYSVYCKSINNSIAVPARVFLTELGYTVAWDSTKNLVGIIDATDNYTLLEVTTVLINGSSYIYIRETAELMKWNLEYDSTTGTITINR